MIETAEITPTVTSESLPGAASVAIPEPRSRSFNQRIFHAAAWVGAAGILVKIVAVFKEMAVAGVYGRSDAIDAFFVAALTPACSST